MKKMLMCAVGAVLIFVGSVLIIAWWDALLLGLKAIAGIAAMLTGAFLVYFARDKKAYEKLIDRLTHREKK
jgi:membrane-bound ClpP family serine protease